jgi:ribonucleoside-diphosphate reductase beta chain
MKDMVVAMFKEAIDAEMAFAQDILEHGVAGLSARDMRTYLEYIADQRLGRLGIPPQFNVRNPFGFMELQDTQELTNFFERRVAAYQVGVTGNVSFDESF